MIFLLQIDKIDPSGATLSSTHPPMTPLTKYIHAYGTCVCVDHDADACEPSGGGGREGRGGGVTRGASPECEESGGVEL